LVMLQQCVEEGSHAVRKVQEGLVRGSVVGIQKALSTVGLPMQLRI
jgi:hypothetical protein